MEQKRDVGSTFVAELSEEKSSSGALEVTVTTTQQQPLVDCLINSSVLPANP